MVVRLLIVFQSFLLHIYHFGSRPGLALSPRPVLPEYSQPWHKGLHRPGESWLMTWTDDLSDTLTYRPWKITLHLVVVVFSLSSFYQFLPFLIIWVGTNFGLAWFLESKSHLYLTCSYWIDSLFLYSKNPTTGCLLQIFQKKTLRQSLSEKSKVASGHPSFQLLPSVFFKLCKDTSIHLFPHFFTRIKSPLIPSKSARPKFSHNFQAKKHRPGDSKWPFYLPVGGHLNHLKGHVFHHPKKVTFAELPGTHLFHLTFSTQTGLPNCCTQGLWAKVTQTGCPKPRVLLVKTGISTPKTRRVVKIWCSKNVGK